MKSTFFILFFAFCFLFLSCKDNDPNATNIPPPPPSPVSNPFSFLDVGNKWEYEQIYWDS